jgi:hypothetical protein
MELESAKDPVSVRLLIFVGRGDEAAQEQLANMGEVCSLKLLFVYIEIVCQIEIVG